MSLVLHLRPTRVPASAIGFTHTFGLGGIALVPFVILFAVTISGGIVKVDTAKLIRRSAFEPDQVVRG